jgi:cobalamin biosynthesis protein CobD/CbiB
MNTFEAQDRVTVELDRERSPESRFPMTVVRSLWSSVQGDPKFMRRLNGWLTIFWLTMIPISIVTGWISSVTYVAALSIWALVSGHWSTWQAARVEVTQQAEAKERENHPVEDRVVQHLVERTNIEPA